MANPSSEKNPPSLEELTQFLDNLSPRPRKWTPTEWRRFLDKKLPRWRATVRQLRSLGVIWDHAGTHYREILEAFLDDLPDPLCAGLFFSPHDEEFEVGMDALNKTAHSYFGIAVNFLFSVAIVFLWGVPAVMPEVLMDLPGLVGYCTLIPSFSIMVIIFWVIIWRNFAPNKKEQQRFRALLRSLKISGDHGKTN